MKLYSSGEDYLEAVLVLKKKMGLVRSIDVARYLEVSKPSVSNAVSLLQEGGFLRVDKEHYLHLTKAGKQVAEKIYERHCFFTKRLIHVGVSPDVAEKDACKIEHVISEETFEKLKENIKEDNEGT